MAKRDAAYPGASHHVHFGGWHRRGNNQLQFDPFLVQLILVVDSCNNEYCLEVVSPTTDVMALSRRQFGDGKIPSTALGKMMTYLGVGELAKLSPMIRVNNRDHPVSPSWVQVYRVGYLVCGFAREELRHRYSNHLRRIVAE